MKSDYMDGLYLAKQAAKAGLKVTPGKGDHIKVFAPEGRGYMPIPARPLGRGLACAIVKWLIAAGVPLALIMLILEAL